jgi:hypothetical protein
LTQWRTAHCERHAPWSCPRTNATTASLNRSVSSRLRHSTVSSPLCTGHHHVDIAAAALRADQPGAPFWDSRIRTKPPGLISRVGLAPMSLIRVSQDAPAETHALNIDIICANSSPAKGRVERAHKTLPDRLVKELRLAGAASLAAGNALLPGFIAAYNARFAKPPVNAKDLHRPLRVGEDLDDAFAWKEERTLSRALTCNRQGALHPGTERASEGGDSASV